VSAAEVVGERAAVFVAAAIAAVGEAAAGDAVAARTAADVVTAPARQPLPLILSPPSRAFTAADAAGIRFREQLRLLLRAGLAAEASGAQFVGLSASQPLLRVAAALNPRS
jgi:hypothetical protein